LRRVLIEMMLPFRRSRGRRGIRIMVKSNLYAICTVYLILITSAELLTNYNQKLGIVFHVGIIFLLLIYASLEYSRVFSQFLISLTLAPLIRVLSLSMPIVQFSRMFWFILLSIPVFIAVFTCIWLQGLHPASLGLRMPTSHLSLEAGVILLGLPFGLIEYQILKPSPLALNLRIPDIIVASLIFIICTGFLEEIVFRGLIQFNTMRVMGRWHGILFISTIFGVLHAGNLTPLDCLLAFFAGFIFSFVREKTGSLYGISLSHGLINIILFMVAPFYF